MRSFCAIAIVCCGFVLPALGGDTSIFDPDPAHPWNRMWQMFYAVPVPSGVTVGPEELDLPIASDLGELLRGSKHRETVALLDQFLENRQADLVRDPVRRAVLQHDLWAIFDWLANPAGDRQLERRALQDRLARIMQRLALSMEEIRALPDNYQSALTSHAFPEAYDPSRRGAAFLPPDLLKADGPWVLLVDGRTRPTARRHVEFTAGRSQFIVFMNLPGGRSNTVTYLDKLRTFPNPWVWEPNYPAFPYARSPVELNPELPQFPEETKFALLRRMILIDNRGNLVPTSLTESLQVRVYRIDPRTAGYGQDADQDVFDVRLRRKHLFAGRNGGLRAVEPDEKDYSNSIALFSGAGTRSPGPSSIMSCGSCHAGPGIFSVLTYTRRAGEQTRRTPWLGPGTVQNEAARTIEWKQQQYSWGLLEGLWRNER